MSIANNYSLTSNDRCHNCGTINVNGTVCSQCQSESFEDVPIQTQNDGISTEDIPQQLSSGNGNEQTSLLREFQNLLNNGYDRQLFTIMLLSMLMSNAQSRLAQHRHRRNRPQRRIKRVTHSLSRYRHLPFLDLSSFHAINTSVSETLTLNIIPEELLNIQFQPNMTLVPVSVPFVIFDQNEDNVDPELLLQLLNEDIGSLSVTRNDVNQLPTLASRLQYLFYFISYIKVQYYIKRRTV